MQRGLYLAVAAAGSTLMMTAQAGAGVTWTGTASGRSASADFSVVAGQLVVTLDNTAATDTMVPTDVFTAIFFNITGSPMSLTRVSGVLGAGAQVYYDADGQPAGGVIGGEWAYVSGISGAPGGRSYGISSTGVGLFGPGDLFPGPNLAGPASPDGPQYGLLTTGDDPLTGNGGITGSDGLIKHSAVFTLGGVGADFDLARVKDVWFQYGTDLSEPGFPGVPAPGSAAVLGLAGLTAARRRRS